MVGQPGTHFTQALRLFGVNAALGGGADVQQQVAIATDDAPVVGSAYYYLRVRQNNGDMAWASPIWVTPQGPAGR